MSKRAKHLALLMLAQSCCLAVGLWMQNHFATSSAKQGVEEQIWADMEADAREFASALEGVDIAGTDAAAAVALRLAKGVNGRQSGLADVLVLDADRRVLCSCGVGGAYGESHPAIDSVVEWIPDASASGGQTGPVRGTVILPDGEHAAAMRTPGGGLGFVLSHCPVAEFEARSAVAVRSWPVIGVITFVWTCALLSIAAYLILARLHDDIDHERLQSATEALRRTQNLVRTRDAVIFGLAKLAESRDPETGDHLDRISVYSTMLAAALRRHPGFRDEVTPAFVRLIGISSALHDIGKVGVEDRILLKPGPLTQGERAEMQVHVTIGGECLRDIERRLGGSNFLEMAREIAFAHHESWDGAGYPYGLADVAIPLPARIVAIADIYDALSTKRVYKGPLPHEECVSIIRSEASKKLDPDLVEVWLTLEKRFRAIALKYASATISGVQVSPAEHEPVQAVAQEAETLCAASIGASNAD